MIYERMRWYHQIGCTSCGCCRSQPDADDKSKNIFLLSFLALVNLGAVWDRGGCGTLLKLDVLVTLLKETLCWDEAAVIPHSLGSLQGRTDLGLIVPCRLQSLRLVTTWRGVVPRESGNKSPVSVGAFHPELWWGFSWWFSGWSLS